LSVQSIPLKGKTGIYYVYLIISKIMIMVIIAVMIIEMIMAMIIVMFIVMVLRINTVTV